MFGSQMLNSRASARVQGAAESPRFARSRRMVNCLRQELLYSEKRPRDILFGAIENLLAEQPEGVIVARLTRESVRAARREAERRGLDFSNWSTVGTAVMKTLLRSESLLSPAGEPIPFGVSAHAAPVGSLRHDYQDRAEGYLLEVLLQRLGDVTPRDHTALAHVLFRQFDPNVPMQDLEDRVAILLAQLAHRVAMEGDVYLVRDAASTPLAPGDVDTAAPAESQLRD